MKRILVRSLVLSLLVVFCAGYAAAELIDGSDPEMILNIARGYGSATLEKDSVGDPMIRGRIDGTVYLVLFYKTSERGDYNSIQFRASWEKSGIDLRTLQDWNAANRFGKTYLDEDGDPVLEFSVNLAYGVSTRNLDDTFDWWRIVLKNFKENILGS